MQFMQKKALCHGHRYRYARADRWTTKTWKVTRLTTFLLLSAVCQVSARSAAQTVTYSAHAAPLTRVLNEIERQTGYTFFYDRGDLQGLGPVTCELKGTPLAEALTAVLTGLPLRYEIQGTAIALVRTPVAIVKPVDAGPLPGEVHGKIVDSTGAPIAGVTVIVKGTKKGASTEPNGEFVVKGVTGNVMLVISNVGYVTQEIALNGREEIRVVLRQSASGLDGMVVKGYYTTTGRLNTGDAKTVKAAEIEEQPVTDPLLTLQGRVPGLYIHQTNGVPGSYGIVRIMGQNSIGNVNNPLYIVDGVPYGSQSLSSPDMSSGAIGASVPSNSNATFIGQQMSPFNALNPDDIESITILKDADATAIYGSRGANGVLLITTKKGKAGYTKVDLDVYSGDGQIARKIKMLNTPQYLEMRHEAFTNDSLTPKSTDYDSNGVWDTTRYTDWQKVLIGNPAYFTSAQINVSGGSENTQFLAGGGYSTQGTVYRDWGWGASGFG